MESGKRARRWRLFLALALCIPIALTVWLRQSRPLVYEGALTIEALPVHTPKPWPAGLSVVRAWHLDAARNDFGGYSALLKLPDGRFVAYADKGDSLSFSLPGSGGPAAVFAEVERDPRYRRSFQDIESATRDPDTGYIWLGYEAINAIRRLNPDGTPAGIVRPRAMREWSPNSGPEAMVRMADGRFVVLNEVSGEGHIYAMDPRAGIDPARFRYQAPDGMHPTDMAQLPDGRLLVLLRSLAWNLPPFHAALALGNPADIEPGRDWPLQLVARLDPGLPPENYEGLDVTVGADGELRLWIISDDNLANLQRTLLAELRWDIAAWDARTKKGAAAMPGAPSE